MDPIVDSIDDLRPEWLAQTLQTSVRAVTAERIGTGQMAATYRLSLDTDDAPTSLVAKIATGPDEARRRVREGYRKEVAFYREVAGTVDVRAPQCWYAAIDDDALRFTLLLEDLAPRVPGVQTEGCSLARVRDALRNLVSLHAPRWNDDSLFDLDVFNRGTVADADFLGAVATSATDEFVRRYAAELEDDDVSTLRAAASATARWEIARAGPFAVGHGDYRLDNLMFEPSGDDVVALDWQTLTVAPPLRDVAYLLGTSLLADDRRSSEADLVGGYHQALMERGVTGYSADDCWRGYRLGQLLGPLITTIGCIYAPGRRTAASDAMFLAMARRSCAAIRDLGSLDLV